MSDVNLLIYLLVKWITVVPKTIHLIDLEFHNVLSVGLGKTVRCCMCKVLRCCGKEAPLWEFKWILLSQMFSMSHYWHHLLPFPLYFQPGSTDSVLLHIMRWMSHKPFPGCIVPQPAATSSKVFQSLIPLPGLWDWGDGALSTQSNQSLSKHTKVLLLLQLETWLNGEEGILLDWSQLHLISIRKFSWQSFSAQMMDKYITFYV